jgi:hypothetical protein
VCHNPRCRASILVRHKLANSLKESRVAIEHGHGSGSMMEMG